MATLHLTETERRAIFQFLGAVRQPLDIEMIEVESEHRIFEWDNITRTEVLINGIPQRLEHVRRPEDWTYATDWNIRR